MAPPAPPRKLVPKDRAPSYFASLKAREYREHRNASSTIRSIAWNNLGNRIGCGLTDRLVRVWNPEKPEIRYSTELKGHTGTVERIQWDPTHSDRLASASTDGTVRFWDYRSAKCLNQVSTGGENISLTYSPDGNYVAVGTKDDNISFIDTRQNQIIKTHKENVQTNQIIWSHGGDVLFLTTGSGLVKLKDWPSLESLHTIEAHTSACFCLELEPRGNLLAVGGSDAIVSLWDTKEWTCPKTLSRMESPVRCLSFSFDGSYLCAGSDEKMNIEIAHVDTGDYVHTIVTDHPVLSIAWHPSRYHLAYSGDPAGLKIVSNPAA
ncbi:WD40 repeat-like protein [Terfezia boudieri ATCC MYA-4762]|uniref:WD40 repeat-like protein n=1 Tax=Terfezia boudieri ATCC MYA-4762 TaxID=1051890 RepID=A0A3N4M058_9PEZI|nr:WD40 repeat-like protein [Terfezia boudieri ATCC MYA-4762]